MTQPTKSNRSDGRGHWPAGKRRNPDVSKWSRIRLALQRLVDHEDISRRELARTLQVNPRSVGRWLDGTDRPEPAIQLALAQLLQKK